MLRKTVTDLPRKIFIIQIKTKDVSHMLTMTIQLVWIILFTQNIKQKRQLKLASSYLDKPLNLLAEEKKREIEILI